MSIIILIANDLELQNLFAEGDCLRVASGLTTES